MAAKQKADEVSAAQKAAAKQKEVELPEKKVVTTQPTPEASVPLWKKNVCVIPDGTSIHTTKKRQTAKHERACTTQTRTHSLTRFCFPHGHP